MYTGRLIFSFILSFTLSCFADDAADKIIRRMSGEMQKVKTLQADFIQVKKMSILNHTITIRGMLCLDRSGSRIAWHVFSPLPYSCILNGNRISQWDADSNVSTEINVRKIPALKVFTESMQCCFSGNFTPLLKNYTYRSDAQNILLLKPKKDSLMERVLSEVRFYPSEDYAYISRVIVCELNGDITDIRFERVQRNHKIPDSLWRFQTK